MLLKLLYVSVCFGEASKLFTLDIAEIRNAGSILSNKRYELIKSIVKKVNQ
ncbi:MAG TPA: hypothetical protein VH878_00815 [Thermodesulfobacteriota bacterium]